MNVAPDQPLLLVGVSHLAPLEQDPLPMEGRRQFVTEPLDHVVRSGVARRGRFRGSRQTPWNANRPGTRTPVDLHASWSGCPDLNRGPLRPEGGSGGYPQEQDQGVLTLTWVDVT